MKSVKVISKVDLGSSEYRICEFPTQRTVRRSVDDFQTRLLNKAQANKVDTGVTLSVHHSKKPAERVKRPIRLTLSIVGTSQSIGQPLTERKEDKKGYRISLMRNTTSQFFSQKMSPLFEMKQEIPLESDQFLQSHSCKIRLLHSSVRQKNIYLVLPVDFLLNELNFWQEEEPDESLVKTWRKLMVVGNIVWLARKQKTLKKIQNFCQRMMLPLDAVYLLELRKCQSITINMKPIFQDLSIVQSNKIIVFNSVDTSKQDSIDSYECLENKLPLINHKHTYVHLIKYKSNIVFLNHVLDILRKEPRNRLNLTHLIDDYKQNLMRNEQNKDRLMSGMSHNQLVDEPVDTLERIEELKKKWTSWIVQMKTLSNKTTMVDGDSVPYIVGDMLKRNYPLLDRYSNRSPSPRRRASIASEGRLRTKKEKIQIERIQYYIPVFLWSF